MARWLLITVFFLSGACGTEYSGKVPPPIVEGATAEVGAFELKGIEGEVTLHRLIERD